MRERLEARSTEALCPACLERAPAEVAERAGAVYLTTFCREHGPREELLEEDADFVARRPEYDKPGTPSLAQTPALRGCPEDCGLCPAHGQHTCIGLLEVTQRCDLRCPVCFAASGPGGDLSLERIEAMLDMLVEAEGGQADVVQISGGEPTLHPRILDIIRLARAKRIRYVMLNTNGLRIAEEPAFAQALGEFAGDFEVYLQFDSLEDRAHRTLRGRALIDVKRRALENLAKHHVPVTLVTTVHGGVNDQELGGIVDFGIRTPCVRGVNFQPLAFFGRTRGTDPADRVTLTGVLKRLQAQTSGMLRTSDFYPLPCNVDRMAIALLLRRGREFMPLARRVDVRGYLGLIDNTIAFRAEDLLKNAAASLLCRDGACSCLKFVKDLIPLAPLTARGLVVPDRDFLSENLFRITVTSFLDRYTFDLRAVRKECVHVLTPDLRRMPFSAYNLLHRAAPAADPGLTGLPEEVAR